MANKNSGGSSSSRPVKETTFYTTYTYLSTIVQDSYSTVKTSKQTSTNVVIGGGRSGGSTTTTGTTSSTYKPTKAKKVLAIDPEEGTTVNPSQGDYYELEGSEGVGVTTNRPDNLDEGDADVDVPVDQATPILRTLLTTFTYYTTFYQGRTSTVSSLLETKSQLVTDTDTKGLSNAAGEYDDEEMVREKAPLLSTSATAATEPAFPNLT